MLLPFLITVTKNRAQMPSSVVQDKQAGFSGYVPIENWIYSAIGYLASAGYIQTAFAGLRTWTRMTCASVIVRAQNAPATLGGEERADLLIQELAIEFAPKLHFLHGASARSEWQMHVETQEERWRFSLLSTTPNHNLTATAQLSSGPSARKF